ncbi:GAF domain-containing protein [Pendulispora albinea]|uniref:GAF domain-containing protein n=1 Tax=Pendulispora albinea TaxID=2741071 RepID=A0ABZ2LT44_9BACT
MRFFVHVTPIGKVDTQSYCVEADSWQKALQSARTLRKEEAPISGFSIELTDDGGCRAVDPAARLRYVVKKAPDTAMLSVPSETIATLSASPSNAKSSVASGDVARNNAGARTIPYGTTGAVAVRTEPGLSHHQMPLPTQTNAVNHADGEPQVLYRREQEPTEESPLLYREDVYVMPEGTTEAQAEKYLRAQFLTIKAVLASSKPGKYVNLAVFDRAFEGRPTAAPLATLSWKDWKGQEPTVLYPRRTSTRPAALTAPTAPAAPMASASGPSASSAATSRGSDSGVLVAPVVSVAAGGRTSAPPSAPPPGIAALGEALRRASQPPPPPSPAPSAATVVAAASVSAAAAASAPLSAAAPAAPPAPAPFAVSPSAAPNAGTPAAAAPISVPPAAAVPAVAVTPVPGPGPAPAPIAMAPEPVFPPPVARVLTPEPRAVPTEVAVLTPPPAPSAPNLTPSDSRISRPPTSRPSRPSLTGQRGRVRGDELIAVLFEAMHDLHFSRDTLEASEFCLQLVLENIPSRAAFAHFYDIDKREYVIVAAVGAGTSQMILRHHPPTDPLLSAAMRKRTAMVIPEAAGNMDTLVERFEQLGGAKSVIVTPVMLGGRALAAIEIVNPTDGVPYNEAEGNAMTYVGEQFAEYVSSHGLVLDTERIRQRRDRQ